MKPLRTIGLIANPHKESAHAIAAGLIERIARSGASVVLAPEISRILGPIEGAQPAPDLKDLALTDLVIVLGGDGTLLHAIRDLHRAPVPLLGVNVGSLGFLTETSAGEIEGVLDRLLAGEFEVVERPLLQGVVENPEGEAVSTLLALNDLVVDDSSAIRRAVLLRMRIGEEVVGTFTADGAVVATPAGSTAYNLSAGGPVLGPDLRALVVTPICPHTLSVRSVVFPDSCDLVLEDIRPGLNMKITADGQVGVPVPEGGRVRVTAPPDRCVRFASLERHSTYEILRTKLHWGAGKSAC